MKFSVIVSIYNCADVLPITVPALLTQDYPSDSLEIILVDDASTDATSSLLRDPLWQERCVVIRHPENRGRCATRNSGLDRATGDVLIFMDCDIQVDSTFVARHAERHQDPGTVGILSNVQPGTRPLRDKYHRYLFEGKRGAKQVGHHKPLPFRYFIMTCSSIKASAVHKTGRFNENLQSYGIDLEYAYRLWKNYPDGLFYAPEIPVLMHRLKALDEALGDFREFGRYNVPVILDDNPTLSSYVGGDFVIDRRTGPSLKTLAGLFIFNPVAASLARGMFHLLPYPLSNVLVRYLMVNSVVRGYRESPLRRKNR
ncbi:MAG: glycosyltransferase [Fidelibacterota bacterium]